MDDEVERVKKEYEARKKNNEKEVDEKETKKKSNEKDYEKDSEAGTEKENEQAKQNANGSAEGKVCLLPSFNEKDLNTVTNNEVVLTKCN